MAANRKEGHKQESAAPQPAGKQGGQGLRAAIMAGVVLLLIISFSNWREISRIQTTLDTRLAQIENRVGQVSAKVEQVAAQPAQPARPGPDLNRVYKVNTTGAPSKGPTNAPITIAEFSDFQCPFCSRVGPTLKKVEEIYGDKVRIAWKHNPLDFHADAPLAHMAALAAHKQDKFWEYHDKLFANQKALKQENLQTYAQELGLDMERFQADLLDLENKKVIDADKAEAQSFQATGTPSFFINGRLVVGAKPFEEFAKVINAELARLNVPVPAEAKAN
ncbi:MAG: thioredoxin domain-containing protein [Deltaproteobacteria bacterium]|nr:thioredoxin domain-containing protein [Deltaproteobacteria bacterium]